MLRLLLTSCCVFFLFSCSQEEAKKQVSIQNNISENTVISFSITAKNNKLTSQSGTNVSMNQMTTKQIKSGEKILFNDLQFTLNNKTDNAVNFYSENGTLICEAPFDLSIMSMPPDINGTAIYNQGDKIKLSGTSLIKTSSANFVISDIIFSNPIEK